MILLGVTGTAGITSIRIRKKFQGSRIKNCQSFKKGSWTPKIQHPQKAWEIHHAPWRFWRLIPRDLRGSPFWCHVTEQVERVGDEHLKLQPGTWELEEKSWRLSILERTTTGKFLVGGFLSRHAWGTLNKWQSFLKSFSERKNCWSLAVRNKFNTFAFWVFAIGMTRLILVTQQWPSKMTTSYSKTIWTSQCRILITHQAALSVRDDLKCQECGWVMVSAWPAWIPDYPKNARKILLETWPFHSVSGYEVPLDTDAAQLSSTRCQKLFTFHDEHFKGFPWVFLLNLKDFGGQARSVESWDVEWCLLSFSFWHHVMICREYLVFVSMGQLQQLEALTHQNNCWGCHWWRNTGFWAGFWGPNSMSLPSILRSEDHLGIWPTTSQVRKPLWRHSGIPNHKATSH